jgi:hypothetical protein
VCAWSLWTVENPVYLRLQVVNLYGGDDLLSLVGVGRKEGVTGSRQEFST